MSKENPKSAMNTSVALRFITLLDLCQRYNAIPAPVVTKIAEDLAGAAFFTRGSAKNKQLMELCLEIYSNQTGRRKDCTKELIATEAMSAHFNWH